MGSKQGNIVQLQCERLENLETPGLFKPMPKEGKMHVSQGNVLVL
jgi:hypothetical protein